LCVIKIPTEKILDLDFQKTYNIFLEKIENQIDDIKALDI
jgi:hypothetical protein